MRNFMKSLAIALIMMVSFVQLSFVFLANVHSTENCEMNTECFLDLASSKVDAAVFNTLLLAAPVFFVFTLVSLRTLSRVLVSTDSVPLLRQGLLQGVVQRE